MIERALVVAEDMGSHFVFVLFALVVGVGAVVGWVVGIVVAFGQPLLCAWLHVRRIDL